MAKGGKREGAGRKRKDEALTFKFQSCFTKKEAKEFVDLFKQKAREKPELLPKLIEQLFGKAPQRVERSQQRPQLTSQSAGELITRRADEK